MAVTTGGREDPRAALSYRLSFDEFYGLAPDRPKLWAALCVLKAYAARAAVHPCAAKREALHATQTSQQQQTDRRQGCCVPSLCLALTDCLANLSHFFDRQESPLFSIGWLSYIPCRVFLDQLERLSGIFEDGYNHPQGASSYARTARGDASAALHLAGPCCLASDDISLHPLNIGGR